MLADGFGHGVDGLHGFAGDRGIRKLKTVILVEGHHQLECVNRIQSQAYRAEKECVVPNFVGGDFEHQLFDEHLFELELEFEGIIHEGLPG